MFNDLRRTLAVKRFDWQCRGILRTPPLRLRTAPIRVVSMVRTEHLRMYLLSIKSFYRHLPGGQVIVMDDGSLTATDKALLAQHVEGLEIMRLDSIRTDPCPRGGCWERLLYILDLSADSYVVQLDSDILTSGPIPEVMSAVAGNTAFTLNSGQGMGIVSLEEAAALVAQLDPKYLQTRIEQALPQLPPDAGGRRYVRGSAGFAGFPRGLYTRAAAVAYSNAMQGLLGARWSDWGTEQTASNYLVANAPGGVVLPWPRYACFDESVDPAKADLLHFVGSWRFDRGAYAAKARRVIAELAAG
ncbi:hypothetical protein [Paracraurococcus ruber]|uniref:Glycosyltransferase n=1 Tax=Paracraurococcus ruber TaxID=77675 RepID=A0ABS1CWG1_9PROT|nr:hypothetical protein [Paracraurococcus ruber]MBK1658292.1 hypothetical protein [Paracraurococcus ruber]TDG31003.1 hypothetical protein E2C05_12300 [Paracraurococcus ruber]